MYLPFIYQHNCNILYCVQMNISEDINLLQGRNLPKFISQMKVTKRGETQKRSSL